MKLEFIKREVLKEKPADESKLGFGRIFSDYMLMMKYDEAKGGWYYAAIEPYENLSISPAALVFHYAQECFEGMKAYRTAAGEVMMFRPWDNVHRMNISGERLCMAPIPEDFLLQSIYELIKVEKDWIPSSPGTSLYIRPTFIGIDPVIGVKAASQYLLYVILSPVGSYYASGLAPVSIYVENKYVRAVKGGTGYTKCGGNYAASLKAGEVAHERGYSQVLWLDGRENKYIDEVGAMNIMFKVNGEVITPELNGSILAGITRDSIIKLARSMGYKVTERRISMQEIADAAENGTLEEVWGTGTAAVVSPVGELIWEDKVIKVGDGGMGKLTLELYNKLTGIQYGREADEMGWTVKL
jgi:branched-chain amino acid aminotransferase